MKILSAAPPQAALQIELLEMRQQMLHRHQQRCV
jgi:hypothetical protein